MSVEVSAAEARRLALRAQRFGRRRARASADDVLNLASEIHAFQIDSVNVLVRAHYVPAFARLGAYRPADLDALAYERRELFEFWGHAACLLPAALHPLLRYRMESDHMRDYLRSERGAYLSAVYREVQERGPLRVADLRDPGSRSGKWWGWGKGKVALELLFRSGLLAISGRRGFERVYDLAERVIPGEILATPAPAREEAMKALVCLAARACGAGTASDILGYFHTDGWVDRLPPGAYWEQARPAAGWRTKPIGKRLVTELVEEGRLVSGRVEGWAEPAYLPPETRDAAEVEASALVTPFDSLVWDRRRLERLFGMRYTIEIYTPAPKRVYGYYVMPFLLGDEAVARCDLKADRARGALLVQGAFLEPGQTARRVARPLWRELRRMARWLGLRTVEVADRGDLAPALRSAAAGQ